MSDDTDVYDGEPMKKYGMLKWQVSESFRNDGRVVPRGIVFNVGRSDERQRP